MNRVASTASRIGKAFITARLKWLQAGFFFALGCWFMVGLAYALRHFPEATTDLIEKARPNLDEDDSVFTPEKGV